MDDGFASKYFQQLQDIQLELDSLLLVPVADWESDDSAWSGAFSYDCEECTAVRSPPLLPGKCLFCEDDNMENALVRVLPLLHVPMTAADQRIWNEIGAASMAQSGTVDGASSRR